MRQKPRTVLTQFDRSTPSRSTVAHDGVIADLDAEEQEPAQQVPSGARNAARFEMISAAARPVAPRCFWHGRQSGMPTKYVSGDLFGNAHNAQAFAHGCNCQGSMGAGIAKEFRSRYPVMYEEYRRRCKAQPKQFDLGDCWLWKAENQPWVFSLGTQESYWRSRASYEAIETALRSMRRQADAERINRIAMPRIGVGYGGLSWMKVRAIMETAFGDWRGTLVVYEEYVSGGSKR
jgi:O-acetyl-ADP-ribose deacetylase (regulator of RNase III)